MRQKHRSSHREQGRLMLVSTTTAERKILELLDRKDGSIQSTDKLIPYLAKLLKEDCHATWKTYESAVKKLQRKGEVELTFSGNVLRGITRIKPVAIPDAPTNDQEVTLMTETTDPTTELHPTDSSDDTTPELDESFGALPLHEQVTRALVALQLHTDDAGIIHARSSAVIIAKDNRITDSRARALNRLLGKLGLRTSKGRLGQHKVDIVINQVTAEMLDALDESTTSPQATTAQATTIDTVQEVPETLIETAPSGDQVTSLAELQSQFVNIVTALEGKLRESRKLVTDLQQEIRTVRRDTEKLIERVCGERDEAIRQLSVLRQAATQPLKLAPEVLEVFGRYAGSPSF